MHIISLLGTFRSVANIEMASFARRGIAVMLAALACVWAQADDFIVNVGETGRIEGTKTYGRILCNGELEIADDAVVTCTSFVMEINGSLFNTFNPALIPAIIPCPAASSYPDVPFI